LGEAEEGKCWADAKQMLLIPPSERDKEASERVLPLILVFWHLFMLYATHGGHSRRRDR